MKAEAFVMIPYGNKKDKWLVAPLVMCKDCKWWNTEWKHEDGECYCYKIDQWTAPHFYCADGERRCDV